MALSRGGQIDADITGSHAAAALGELGHPAVVVASTTGIAAHGPFSFEDACRSEQAVPSAPDAPVQTGTISHVIVGMSQPVNCHQVAAW